MVRCPYCSTGVLASQAFCSSCGRPLPGAAPGLTNQAGMYAPVQASPAGPAAALSPQAAQAGKEKRHHWIWLGSLITIGSGGWVIYSHWQGKTGLGVAIALFALSALSLGLSRFGARWNRASCLEKLLILPGVLAGLVVLAFILLSGSDSDSSQSQSGKGSSQSKSGQSQRGTGEQSDFNPFDGKGTGGRGDDLNWFEGDEAHRRGRQANPLPFQACPRCGQMVPIGINLCPRCGQPLLSR